MITFVDVEEARQRIQNKIYLSPFPYSETISQIAGSRVFFKLDNLQMTGSFKERGALNRLLTLTQDEAKRGVIAASAGNHGMAVAFHSQRLNIAATIVMPLHAPLIKVSRVRQYGAETVLHGADYDSAFAEAERLSQEKGLTLIHAFNDPWVVAGQGTIGVQAEALSSMKAALEKSKPIRLPRAATIADGIAVRTVGATPLELIKRYVDEIVTVNEGEIAKAVLLLLEIEKTVAEGAAAAPLAALVNDKVAVKNMDVGLIVSGGNIDMNLISRIIEKGLIQDSRLTRFSVVLPDRPGTLARLSQRIGELGANILHIAHSRGFGQMAIGETEVELILETTGPEHIQRIHRALTGEKF